MALGAGLGLFAVFVLGDWLLPRDMSAAIESDSWIFDLPVYAILPLLIAFNGALLWMLGSGDVAQIGEWLRSLSGIDLFRAAPPRPTRRSGSVASSPRAC